MRSAFGFFHGELLMRTLFSRFEKDSRCLWGLSPRSTVSSSLIYICQYYVASDSLRFMLYAFCNMQKRSLQKCIVAKTFSSMATATFEVLVLNYFYFLCREYKTMQTASS